jgi:tetratricopeptide (TPR) repeat protein
MNVEAMYVLLKLLTLQLSAGRVRDLLGQSLIAYQKRDWQQVQQLAEQAQKLSRSSSDLLVRATALLHLGLAWGRLGQFDEAAKVISLAKRVYHRSLERQSRVGEALAALVLGWLYDRSSDAIPYYREALQALGQLQEGYAAEGNYEKEKALQQIGYLLRLRIDDQPPTLHIGGRAFTLTPVAESDQGILELEYDVEYRIIPVEHDQYDELGLSPGDSMLVHRIPQLEELVTGSIGVCHLPNGESAVGKFERNAEGNVRFVELGAKARIIGDLKANSASSLDAVLKLADG